MPTNIELVDLSNKGYQVELVKDPCLTPSDMRILLTNYKLDNLGGSESFTYTLCKELQKRGFEVDVYSPVKGKVSELLPCVDAPKEWYHLILCNHHSTLQYLLDKDVQGFKVLTCHGIYPPEEQPIDGADVYVGISEEVCEHLLRKGYTSFLIRNGIDCTRFSPREKIGVKPKRVLSLCHGERALLDIRNSCEREGLELKAILPGLENRKFEIEELMNWADIVVGLGRSAYEAMACGRNVFVYDARNYTDFKTADGFMTVRNIQYMRRFNCSGRAFKTAYSHKLFVEGLLLYHENTGNFNRGYALQNFNVEHQVNQYLTLYWILGEE